MAIDFPANPTNGQVWGNYIYDSSITAWRNVNTDTGIGTLNAMGLKSVVPTSINVGSGSATVNANGLVTFTGASSVSLNGVFTSVYNSYRIIFVQTEALSAQDFGMQLKVSGSSAATAYYANGSVAIDSSITGYFAGNSSQWVIGSSHPSAASVGHAMAIVDVSQPALARPTTMHSKSTAWTSTQIKGLNFGGFHTTQTAYDGFQIFIGGTSQTFGGTLSVYGYTN